tara:strand:+ start:1114 stop:1482 length:369 start_codon:yes stop_codon:yes gene_type:complete
MEDKPSGKILLDKNKSTFDADWEDVLDTINIKSLPIRYINHLKINLKNNKNMIIDVKSIVANSRSLHHASEQVNAILSKNKQNIVDIDFSIRIDEMMENITKAKNSFAKKINFKMKREGKKK